MSYWVLFGIIALISWLVQANLDSKFKEYSRIPLDNGMTGRDVAIRMLHDNDIYNDYDHHHNNNDNHIYYYHHDNNYDHNHNHNNYYDYYHYYHDYNNNDNHHYHHNNNLRTLCGIVPLTAARTMHLLCRRIAESQRRHGKRLGI